ncbi:MAG: hypothetical protein V1746_08165 [bacterium]
MKKTFDAVEASRKWREKVGKRAQRVSAEKAIVFLNRRHPKLATKASRANVN